jgi:hypothetical protein
MSVEEEISFAAECVEDEKAAYKRAYHDGYTDGYASGSGFKFIGRVVNNNQPGWQNIIETEPHCTLPIGTAVYVERED